FLTKRSKEPFETLRPLLPVGDVDRANLLAEPSVEVFAVALRQRGCQLIGASLGDLLDHSANRVGLIIGPRQIRRGSSGWFDIRDRDLDSGRFGRRGLNWSMTARAEKQRDRGDLANDGRWRNRVRHVLLLGRHISNSGQL